ncbi:MAG: hypothetical protein NTU73_11670 [Ignavibacteriae bacterium]|nr:hypothetical protein [Ignavibacteriota bacterium]
MKKCFIILIVYILFSGCSGIDLSTVKVNNVSKLKSIKAWFVEYDTAFGYLTENSFITNQLINTPFENSSSYKHLPNPAFLYSEKRGEVLTADVKTNMFNKLKLLDDGDGIIKFSRPMFLDDGRYILYVKAVMLDRNEKKLAELQIFNRCRSVTTSSGIKYEALSDIKGDKEFAAYCTEKILELFKQ